MTLFILTETAAGYAIFKAKDKKLLKRDDLAKESETAAGVTSLMKLKQFRKFDSAASALEEAAALTEGKVTPMLSNMLSELKDEKKISLAVADPKLGNAITKLPGLQITPVSDSTTAELYRGIREHLPSLISDLKPEDISTMSLGLSHSLSRHKLKFSPDKVDTMIIQAIALLDDLDKELNTYAMRVKEWYGWHFPEMARIINDNLAYSRIIIAVGMRSNISSSDLSTILPEEIEGAIKAAAEVSMGTEITEEDLINIQALAEQVVGFTEYRSTLASYLSARMQAIAPNLTALVGDLVGARLIAHAGSLMTLAKKPASTVQILGAEKALFRALKTKHDTPKYGLIFHASLIGQATGKNKGKIARMLATKATLGLRVDALSDWGQAGVGKEEEPTEEEKAAVGVAGRTMIERRLRALEGKPLKFGGNANMVAIGPTGQQKQPGKWDLKEARKYNADADGMDVDAAPPAAATTNGDSASKKKLIEELPGNAANESDDSDSDDDEAEPASTKKSKGKSSEEKAAKAARKAEKAAKKAAKAAKKAAKEEKVAKEESKKKRKADDDEEKPKKKKQKKESKA